jgi:hypothetical protein
MHQHAQDTSGLFNRPRPHHPEEATRSWWLDITTRDAFNEAVIRESLRMARSRTATQVKWITIGWPGSTA